MSSCLFSLLRLLGVYSCSFVRCALLFSFAIWRYLQALRRSTADLMLTVNQLLATTPLPSVVAVTLETTLQDRYINNNNYTNNTNDNAGRSDDNANHIPTTQFLEFGEDRISI